MFSHMISLSHIYFSYVVFDVIFNCIATVFILITSTRSERYYESLEQNLEAHPHVCARVIFYVNWY